MGSQLSYGFKSLQTFGDPTKKFQNHHFYVIFSKMVSKVSIPHKGFLRRSRNWRRSRQPGLVLHVLRLVLHVLCSSRFRVPPLPTSYRLPAKREALVVK